MARCSTFKIATTAILTAVLPARRSMSLVASLAASLSMSLVAILVLTAAGCSPASEDSSSGAQSYRLLWPPANFSSGDYSFQDVSLSSFREPDKLRGDAAEIIVDPKLSSGGVVGEEPIGRWLKEGSRWTPADFVTLQAAVIYGHFEKLMNIDRSVGVLDDMMGRPRIGLLARLSETPSSPIILNNAIYDGQLDSLFIVPYVITSNFSPSSRLPISMNAGILGHEHFHRIFQWLVLNRIREAARIGSVPYGWDDAIGCSWDERRHSIVPEGDAPIEVFSSLSQATTHELVPMKVFNQVMLRGLNEGFADFWGWAYSKDESFVGRSLGTSEDAVRRLDKPVASVPLKTSLRNSLITVGPNGFPVLKSEGGRVAAAYRFGTEYARILRGFVEALIRDANQDREKSIADVRLALASSARDLASDIVVKWGREELDPEMLLKPMLSRLVKMSPSGPAVLDASSSRVVCGELNRLNASTALKQGLCGETNAPVGAGVATGSGGAR